MKIKEWNELNGVKNEQFKIFAPVIIDNKLDFMQIRQIDNLFISEIRPRSIEKKITILWLKSFGFDIEFEEQPKLTEQEWHLVRGLPDGYWARDKNGNIFWHETFPNKFGDWWVRSTNSYLFPVRMLPFIKWEDEKPWTSEELKKLERR